MNRTQRLFLIVTCSFWGVFCLAQENSQIELRQVLSEVESKYNCTFNYLANTIEGIKVTQPPSTLSFSEVIDYLQLETNLIFSVLDDNFVSVRKGNRLVLCGFLRDKDTQRPIESATVQTESGATLSRADGYFELVVTGKSTLVTIRHLGYKTLQQSYVYFHLENCAPIYLLGVAETLGEVVLSNYLVEGINRLHTGGLETDFSKFRILPGLIETDVLQAIQAFPGVQSINETVSNINIRGGTHDQNLILWDDIKMYQSGHFFGLISAFNPQITEKVTVQKNGTSVSYSDGVSGTIAMRTKEEIVPKAIGNIGVNLIDASGFIDLPIGKRSSVQVAARKSLSDFVTTPTYTSYFDRISQDTEVANNGAAVVNTDRQFDFYDASLRWLYQISDKDKLRLNFINFGNNLVFNENALVDNTETVKESSVSQNSIAGGLYYERTWNKHWITELQLYETDYTLRAINSNILDSQRFLQENVVSETGAKINGFYRLNKSWRFLLGYQFIETKVTNLDDVDVPVFRSLIAEVVRSHSGYGEVNYYSRDEQSRAYLGFRYNYLDKFNKHLYEPRFSFSQKFASNFNWELAGELKHQVMSQVINFQNDFLGVEKRRWQLSNDGDIPLIRSQQLSTAINYSRKGWLLSAEGYVKKVDGITTQSQGFQNQFEFIKAAGSYTVKGVDFLIRKRFQNVNLWMSYSFMDNEYTFEDLSDEPFRNNFDISHSFTFGSNYVYKNFKVSTGLNWHTGKPTTAPLLGTEVVNEAINFGAPNSVNLDDYLRVDASAIYEFSVGNARGNVGVSVWNVLDKENEIGNYYRVSTTGTPVEFIEYSLGFTPNALLRVYF